MLVATTSNTNPDGYAMADVVVLLDAVDELPLVVEIPVVVEAPIVVVEEPVTVVEGLVAVVEVPVVVVEPLVVEDVVPVAVEDAAEVLLLKELPEVPVEVRNSSTRKDKEVVDDNQSDAYDEAGAEEVVGDDDMSDASALA